MPNFDCGCPGKPEPIDSAELILAHIDPDENVTTKFIIDGKYTIAQVYNGRMTIENVLVDLSEKFTVDIKYLFLTHDDDGEGPLPDTLRICEIPNDQFGVIQLNLHLTEQARIDNEDEDKLGRIIRLDPDVFYR